MKTVARACVLVSTCAWTSCTPTIVVHTTTVATTNLVSPAALGQGASLETAPADTVSSDTALVATPLSTTPDDATAARIQALRAQWEARGFVSATYAQGFAMRAGSVARWPARLYEARCYVFALFGGPGVEQTRFTLRNGDDTETVLEDAENGRDVHLAELCPDHTTVFQLRPGIVQGEGAVWFLTLARRR